MTHASDPSLANELTHSHLMISLVIGEGGFANKKPYHNTQNGDSRSAPCDSYAPNCFPDAIRSDDAHRSTSPSTRALMVRDMHLRRYQREHLDELFGVIRKNPSGMACLARFAKEKLMGGEVAFAIDVEGENKHLLDQRHLSTPCVDLISEYQHRFCLLIGVNEPPPKIASTFHE